MKLIWTVGVITDQLKNQKPKMMKILNSKMYYKLSIENTERVPWFNQEWLIPIKEKMWFSSLILINSWDWIQSLLDSKITNIMKTCNKIHLVGIMWTSEVWIIGEIKVTRLSTLKNGVLDTLVIKDLFSLETWNLTANFTINEFLES